MIELEPTNALIQTYFRSLVNRFYKILPIKESGGSTLATYIRSLKLELWGCRGIVSELQNDASYLTLLSILQYFEDNPDCDVKEVRREVFRAINICKKLGEHFCGSDGE